MTHECIIRENRLRSGDLVKYLCILCHIFDTKIVSKIKYYSLFMYNPCLISQDTRIKKDLRISSTVLFFLEMHSSKSSTYGSHNFILLISSRISFILPAPTILTTTILYTVYFDTQILKLYINNTIDVRFIIFGIISK